MAFFDNILFLGGIAPNFFYLQLLQIFIRI